MGVQLLNNGAEELSDGSVTTQVVSRKYGVACVGEIRAVDASDSRL